MSGHQLHPEYSPQPLHSDGLQVVPEISPPSAPEWISGGYEDPSDQKFALDNGDETKKKEAPYSAAVAARPWWKRKTILLSIIGALVLLIIALGVGLGVGLSSNQGNGQGENDGSDTTSNPPTDCIETLCPQIVSATVHESSLFTFARTSKNTIATRNYTDGGSSDDSWGWGDWLDLGKSDETDSSWISEPYSISWEIRDNVPRLDVFAVNQHGSEKTLSVSNTWYTEVKDPESPEIFDWSHTSWHTRGDGEASSAIALCVRDPQRLYLWMRDVESRNITYSGWIPEDFIQDDEDGGREYGLFTGDIEGYKELASQSGAAGSAPAVVCRDSSANHDVLWYDEDRGRLMHTSSSEEDEWSRPASFAGDWIGDPTVVSFDDSPERWDFFGVQANHELWHIFQESSSGDYNITGSLKGSIASMPSIISLGPGLYDLVALGTDGNMQHIHYNGDEWSDWEKLDIQASSAPSLAVVNGQIFLLAVSKDGNLSCWTKPSTISTSWKDSWSFEDLGGDLTLEFLNPLSL